jgi:KipI family sensor histidine kinase inhibitor
MQEYKVLPAGDTALVVEFGDRIDRQLSAWVLALSRRLNEARLAGIVETVPTFRSLMVHFEPLRLPAAELIDTIAVLMRGLHASEPAGRHWRLPACYDPIFAPDLDHVAGECALSPAQVVECHSAVTYHVYMLGFLPGMAYLGDLAGGLVLPRRTTPRPRIAAGSRAIATTMTCVYPLETPCGWHLIGRSPAEVWQRRPTLRALLAPGDKVNFSPVSLDEYESLMAQAAAGTLRIEPDEGWVGVAA